MSEKFSQPLDFLFFLFFLRAAVSDRVSLRTYRLKMKVVTWTFFHEAVFRNGGGEVSPSPAV